MNKSARGFTLIEILIVTAMISALSAISINTYVGSQKRARDAQRRSDLKQYQVGLEAYAVKNGSYPLSSGGTPLSTSSGCSSVATSLKLSSCPVDPKYGTPTYVYWYVSDSASSRYAIWARLEAYTSTTYLVYCSNGNSFTSGGPNIGSCP